MVTCSSLSLELTDRDDRRGEDLVGMGDINKALSVRASDGFRELTERPVKGRNSAMDRSSL